MCKREKSIRLGLTFTVLILFTLISFAETGGSFARIGLTREASAKIEPSTKLLTPGACDLAGAFPIEVESTGGVIIPTGYNTLSAAFGAINNGTHTGAVTIDVCGNTNEGAGTALLNPSGTGSASYTSVVVSPAGGAARTISGATIAGSPLVDMNGADNVTIDGLNTGGNSLSLINTTVSTTSGTSTIRLINDATTNTIKNTTINGSSQSISAGTIIIGATNGTSGNDSNTITGNNIGPAGTSLPYNAVYGAGSTTSTALNNSGVQVTNNKIYDYFAAGSSSSGILVSGGNTDWTIIGNSFFQTASRTAASGNNHYGIQINNPSGNNFVVSNNTIGGSDATVGGTPWTMTGAFANRFLAISMNVGTTGVSSVQGNTIKNFNWSTSSGTTVAPGIWIGIFVQAGLINIGNTAGNTIGATTGTGSITITTAASGANSFGIASGSSSQVNIFNNNIGSINLAGSSIAVSHTFTAIQTTSGTNTISGNTIGSPITANSINAVTSSTTATAQSVTGINNTSSTSALITGNTIANLNNNYVGTGTGQTRGIIAAGGFNVISNNTVRDLSSSAVGTSTGSSGILIGISDSASGNQTITGNTIHSLRSTAPTQAVTLTGIYLSLSTSTTNLVERNFVHSLSHASTGAAVMTGIYEFNGSTTFQNNMIRLGIDSLGNPAGTGTSFIYGFELNGVSSSVNNLYHNSIYIGGAGSAGSNVAGIRRTVAETNNILNNIISVTRGLLIYSIPSIALMTSNYNVFNSPNTPLFLANGTSYSTLSAWQSSTGKDANSIFGDPKFVSPNGTAATVDLHIDPASTTVIESNGTPVASVTNDFDNQTRASLTPVDIGADAGNFTGVDLAAPNISYTAQGNTASTSNRIVSVTITDMTGVASGAVAPRIYFRKSTDASYVSTQCLMTGGTAQNGIYDCTIDYTLVGGGAVAVGDTIQFFVVAQDTAATPNVGSSPSGATGADVNIITFNGTPSSYNIVPSIGGSKTVGAGGDYATLTAAVAALNSAIITAPVTLTLTEAAYNTGTGETFPLTIQPNSGSSASNTVTIRPATGVNPIISGSSSTCVLNLNGADFVTVDGSDISGGTARNLTINNTSNGTTSAVVCLTSIGAGAGATNNTVKNLNIGGTTTLPIAGTLVGIFSGGTTISITSAGADNDSNTIRNNSIVRTSYGIYSGGASASNKNTGTLITRNVMSAVPPTNVTTGGILVNFDDGAVISRNDLSVLKQDGSAGSAGTAFAIALGVVPSNTTTAFAGSDVTNAQVLANRINGVATFHATGYSAFGIIINSVTSGTTLVANNMISGVRSLATPADFSAGILAGGGTGSTTRIYHNTVAMTGNRFAATSPSYALAIGSGNPVVDVKNNIFYNTQTSTSTGKSYAIANGSTTFTNMTSEFNDLYVSGVGTFVGQAGGLGTAGTDRATLSDWNAATGSDAPSSSVSVDPLFVNLGAADLHLTAASPVLSSGTNVQLQVPVDFDGDPRPSAPDMGADELVQAEGGVLPGGTYYNAVLNQGYMLGNIVTITGNITLDGVSSTGPSKLTLGCNATVTGAGPGNYIVGLVEKQFCAPGTFTYPVGTTPDNARSAGLPPPEYSPMTANVTALGVNPSSLTVSATDTFLPGLVQSSAVSRFWTVNETGDLVADMTFQYLDQDVNGSEASYKVFRRSGGFTTEIQPSSVNPAANAATVTGVSSFSDWGIGALIPSAASINIAGRVTMANGVSGLPRVNVTLTGGKLSQPVSVRTNPFGYYSFESLEAGQTYVLTIDAKQYTFAVPTRVITADDNINNVDFIANP